MSRRRKYELAYDHKLKDFLSQLALTMNTPRKVDFARIILRDTETPLARSFADICNFDPFSYQIARVALAEVERVIIHSSWKGETLPFTNAMRYALERFIAPLGDHDSALLASESAFLFTSDDFALRTHGMSFSDEKASRETHSALFRLENAIREAIEGKQEVAR